MSEMPPSKDESEDVDDHYRRVSALDPSRPSEPVRRAVLEHAARLAEERTPNAERTANNATRGIGSTRPARHRTWWRPAAFGTLAAAMLAGVLIAPQFLTPRAPPSASAPAQVSQPKAAATPAAPAEMKEQPRRSAADERAPAPPPAPVPSPASPNLQGNPAPASDSAPEIAAKNAAVRAESMANARNGAAAGSASSASSASSAGSDSDTDARQRMQALAHTSGMLAAPRAAAPAPQELAAQVRRAAEIGDVTTLQSLLGKQPVMEARDADGRTALMLAALHGQAAAVDALLARGADPNAADARGMTPLQAAVAGNQPAIVAALQRAGAR
jgi:Ankyrin repeats (3 copies)